MYLNKDLFHLFIKWWASKEKKAVVLTKILLRLISPADTVSTCALAGLQSLSCFSSLTVSYIHGPQQQQQQQPQHLWLISLSTHLSNDKACSVPSLPHMCMSHRLTPLTRCKCFFYIHFSIEKKNVQFLLALISNASQTFVYFRIDLALAFTHTAMKLKTVCYLAKHSFDTFSLQNRFLNSI